MEVVYGIRNGIPNMTDARRISSRRPKYSDKRRRTRSSDMCWVFVLWLSVQLFGKERAQTVDFMIMRLDPEMTSDFKRG